MTPVKVDVLEQLLVETNYDVDKTRFLTEGFRTGFDIKYTSPTTRQSESRNLPFTVGNKEILWNKIMKEVEAKRVAGPYDKVPFDNYMQSPIGLVPKAGKDQTRLIFHLSYEFKIKGQAGISLNSATPREFCSVVYNDIDHAVRQILILRDEAMQTNGGDGPVVVYFAKSDVRGVFRLLPLSPHCWAWLIMKAENPRTGKMQYFVDKMSPVWG